jgi:hypothetical protein
MDGRLDWSREAPPATIGPVPVTVRHATNRDLERCIAIVRGLHDYFTEDVPGNAVVTN